MLYLGYFLFLKYKFKFYFFNNKFLLKLQKNIIINFNIKFYNYIVYFLKKSYIFFYFILKDLTSVDNNINLKYNNILTYWLFFESNLLFFENLIFIFFLKKNINSLENFFFNAKWLEKENLDNFGLNYKNKKDQRNLFLIPLFNNKVLLKKFPTNGFYEIFCCFFLKKIKFKKNTNHIFLWKIHLTCI